MRTEGIPHAAANVVIVNVENDVMGIIRETLAAEAVLPNASTDFSEALDVILRTYPEVVIVGFDNDPEAAVELARQIQKERLRAVLIAVAERREANNILTAMRAGYSEFVCLPTDAEQMRAAVHAANFDDGEDEGKGLVIAVCGAKGGTGTTFLATHLASELASIHRVLCIDFDFNMGDIAPAMDIVPKDTVADLLPRADQVDERMLTGSVHVHPSKVHFLCQPNDIEQTGDVNGDDVFNVLLAAASGYQYVIVDVGSTLDEAAATTLNVADQVLLITTPDVVAVRDAHRKLNALNSLGVERNRVNLVLNKVPKQPFLTRETIEANLAIPVTGQVVEDTKRVEHAINEGRILRELYPRSEIVTDVARLVGLLSDDPDEIGIPIEPEAPKGLFARIFGR